MIHKDYERRYFKFRQKNISYLVAKGASTKTVICFPQGLRDSDYFISKYKIIPQDWNAYVLDPPGVGHSDSFGNQTDLSLIVEIFHEFVKQENINLTETILLSKSFASTYAEKVLRELQFKGAIIIAGPRLFSTPNAYFLATFFTLGKKLRSVRKILNRYIQRKSKNSAMKMDYTDWRQDNVWYMVASVLRDRLRPLPTHTLPTKILLNGHDELIPRRNINQIKRAFTNSSIAFLPTTSHWGAVCDEEYQLLHDYLINW